MDIACPQCAAAYEIDSASVTPAGRKVRCADCTTVWRVFPAGYDAETGSPPPENAGPEAAPPPNEPAMDAAESLPERPFEETEVPAGRARLTRSPQAKRQRINPFRALLSWQTAAIAATLLTGAAAYLQRERVVRHLPQTARLYAAVGHPVNLRGIEIRNVSSRIIGEGDDPVLVVDGDLVNITDRKVDVPRLHFTVTGKDGQKVFAWSAQADRTSLQPGEKLNFRRRVAAPPAEARDVSVRFLLPSDMTAGIK